MTSFDRGHAIYGINSKKILPQVNNEPIMRISCSGAIDNASRKFGDVFFKRRKQIMLTRHDARSDVHVIKS